MAYPSRVTSLWVHCPSQLKGVLLPPACSPGSYPFTTEVAFLGVCLVASATALAARAAPLESLLRHLGRAALVVCLIAYPAATLDAVRLVYCPVVPMSSVAFAALDGGSSSISAAFSGTGSVSTSLLASDPYYVCWASGGAHRPVGVLAVISLALYVIALPLVAWVWVWRDAAVRPRATDAGAPSENGGISPPEARALHPDKSPLVDTAPSDPLLAPFLADTVPSAWYFRHCELAVTLALAATGAIMPTPATAAQAAGKAVIIITALSALLTIVAAARPYPPSSAWKGPVKALLLILSIGATTVALIADLAAINPVAYGSGPARTFITGGSYVLFALSVLVVSVLLVGVGRSVYEGARDEERRIIARLAEATASQMISSRRKPKHVRAGDVNHSEEAAMAESPLERVASGDPMPVSEPDDGRPVDVAPAEYCCFCVELRKRRTAGGDAAAGTLKAVAGAEQQRARLVLGTLPGDSVTLAESAAGMNGSISFTNPMVVSDGAFDRLPPAIPSVPALGDEARDSLAFAVVRRKPKRRQRSAALRRQQTPAARVGILTDSIAQLGESVAAFIPAHKNRPYHPPMPRVSRFPISNEG